MSQCAQREPRRQFSRRHQREETGPIALEIQRGFRVTYRDRDHDRLLFMNYRHRAERLGIEAFFNGRFGF